MIVLHSQILKWKKVNLFAIKDADTLGLTFLLLV